MSETMLYRRELTSRLVNATEDIAWIIRGLGRDHAAYTPGPGEWSIHEHLAHLRDMEEQVYLPLLRWATVPDMLDPRTYNRRDWHDARYAPDEPISAIMADIGRIREEEQAIFRNMTDATWLRFRQDTQWGPLSCQWIAELMYRHVLDHLQGIMGLKQDLNLAALQPPALVVGGYIGGRA